MPDGPTRVLFLGKRNAARTILAEAVTRAWAGGQIEAFSAGTDPAGSVDRLALEVLQWMDLPTGGLRSKAVWEFDQPDAPAIDLVIALCDEPGACPAWPGHPAVACWPISDPTATRGTVQQRLNAYWAATIALAHAAERLLIDPAGAMPGAPLIRRRSPHL